MPPILLQPPVEPHGPYVGNPDCMNIWIDLDNSPHVPFFAPIIKELERRGHSVTLTVRDAFQVCELADLFGLTYRRIGRHYGKHTALKIFGTCVRALQLFPSVASRKIDLALSHGSRSQLLVAAARRMPSLVILDYEFAHHLFINPTWVMAPEVIPSSAIPLGKDRILRYPGIKEDVYVPGFKPDSSIRARLGLTTNDVVVTVRPPADEAHYRNPQSDVLFCAAIGFLRQSPLSKIVLLPRTCNQEASVRKAWPDLVSTRKIIIPEHAVEGLNLIWHSDLVISGGGTMNREAAALGVPVYSIFRGKIGAVDRYLADAGRLILLESAEDVRTKIVLKRRPLTDKPEFGHRAAFQKIVDNIVNIAAPHRGALQYEAS